MGDRVTGDAAPHNAQAYYDEVNRVAEHILALTDHRPWMGMILGSGLGGLADSLEDAKRFPYGDLPGFPQTTVEGHAGQLVIGTLKGAPVIVMQGRFHAYEGHPSDTVTFPVRVMRQLGVRYLLVTNSSGGINPAFHAGDLMLITDHLNLTGTNALIGPNLDKYGPRFPDMSFAYDPDLSASLAEVAADLKLTLHKGVYAGLLGPTYETPAEVRMLGILGADVVGMSTVPEVIIAVHAGLKVVGVSCVANAAAGLHEGPIEHEDVATSAGQATAGLIAMIEGFVARLVADDTLEKTPLAGAIV